MLGRVLCCDSCDSQPALGGDSQMNNRDTNQTLETTPREGRSFKEQKKGRESV